MALTKSSYKIDHRENRITLPFKRTDIPGKSLTTQQSSWNKEVSTSTTKPLFHRLHSITRSNETWSSIHHRAKCSMTGTEKPSERCQLSVPFLLILQQPLWKYLTPWNSQWMRWRFLEADTEAASQVRDSYLQPACPEPAFAIWGWKYTKWGELPRDFYHHLHKEHTQKKIYASFPLMNIIC